jgi:hypothetical protein
MLWSASQELCPDWRGTVILTSQPRRS